MPELPEVETIATNFRLGRAGHPALVGRIFRGAQVLWGRSLADPLPEELNDRIAGQGIVEIGRRAKYLVFRLSQDTLLIHLRMSGDLLVEPISLPVAPHHRLLFWLDHDQRLAFNDARKFGRVWLTSEPDVILKRLGPEPLDEDLTPEVFYERLHARRRQLKPLLLDQAFIAGLGNIYTDEALHLARLHPLSLTDLLTRGQAEILLNSIRITLNEGIRRNGASIDWVYRGGDFQNYFRVYQRTGKACPECGTIVKRLVVGQRGTHYCPVCQPEQTR